MTSPELPERAEEDAGGVVEGVDFSGFDEADDVAEADGFGEEADGPGDFGGRLVDEATGVGEFPAAGEPAASAEPSAGSATARGGSYAVPAITV
nr:hypothetical protein [Streptomyces chengmaiensis]